jgi:hypothetical protein
MDLTRMMVTMINTSNKILESMLKTYKTWQSLRHQKVEVQMQRHEQKLDAKVDKKRWIN